MFSVTSPAVRVSRAPFFSSQKEVSEFVHAFRGACNDIFAPLHLDALADGLQIAAPLWYRGLAVSEGHVEFVQFVEETKEKGAYVG